MRYGFQGDKEGGKLLTDARLLMERKMAEIHRLILPDLTGPLTPDQLKRITIERMNAMEPSQQVQMKIKLGLAIAELDKVMDHMSGILSGIGAEMQKLSQHSRAVSSYGQTGRNTRAYRR